MLWLLLIMKLRSMKDKWAASAAPFIRRLFRSALLRLTVGFVFLMGMRSVLGHGAKWISGDSKPLFAVTCFGAGLLIPALYAALFRLMERRRITELARRGALRETAFGLLAGFAIITLSVLVMAAGGGYRITAFTPSADLSYIFLYCLLTAAAEETVFRGVIYRITEERAGSAAALAVSALLFGGAHIFNPNASLWSSAAIAVEAGILLGAVFAWRGNLWFPIGIHWAWNFTEGRIWGLPVSGGRVGLSLFEAETSGSELLTGGAFGPEASLPVVAICIAMSAYVIYRMHRTGRWRNPFRRTRRA